MDEAKGKINSFSKVVRFALAPLVTVVLMSCSMTGKSENQKTMPKESSKFKIFYLVSQWESRQNAGASAPTFVLNSMHTFNHSDDSILGQEFFITGVFNILQQPLDDAVQRTAPMFALYVRIGCVRFERLARMAFKKYGQDLDVNDLIEKLGVMMDSFDEFIAEQLKAIDKT